MNPFSDTLNFFLRGELPLHILWLLLLTIAIEFVIVRRDSDASAARRRSMWVGSIVVLALLAYALGWPKLGGIVNYLLWVCLLASLAAAGLISRRREKAKLGVVVLWVIRAMAAIVPAVAIGFTHPAGAMVYLLWMLVAASVYIALLNLHRDPGQRTLQHLWMWAVRLFIGGLWWQNTLWKLPPTYTDNPDGVSGGLHFWIGEMVKNAAFALQADFVRDVIQPRFYFFAPQVFAVEVVIGISLLLGFFGRVGGALGALMALNLWLGLYRASYEWPWAYFFLILVQATFVVFRTGRSLGCDALLAARQTGERKGIAARVIAWLT
ncbi:MAG TPA: hypothetical protein VJH03_02455 [Blastocatellia bacterium]|nr:hypothetical protein [Blastocatellia bacterium]